MDVVSYKNFTLLVTMKDSDAEFISNIYIISHNLNDNGFKKIIGENYKKWKNVTICILNNLKEYAKFFLRDYKSFLDWDHISINYNMSEELIKDFKYFVNWNLISMYQKLTRGVIDDNKELLKWPLISEYQKLDPDLIFEYRDMLDWDRISINQEMPEDLIIRCSDYVNWKYIFSFQNLSNSFKNKYNYKI